MVFSKSFGYALRGLLYVAMINETSPRVQLDEISKKLAVPRYFLGKVMKKLVKGGVLKSKKGPYGGFYIHEKTLSTTLLQLTAITGDTIMYGSCVLRFRKCNAENPCPLHRQVEFLKNEWQNVLASTNIGDLLKKNHPDFLKSIAVI
ncbi:MAG: Rrf2 family transcriptional regulator [Sphingobacteriales bacterium]|nr:Rrf2 family transcriptional regulator [Sphingobacteriales bacterium]